MFINDFLPADWHTIFDRIEPLLPGFYRRLGPPHDMDTVSVDTVRLHWYEPPYPSASYQSGTSLSILGSFQSCHLLLFTGMGMLEGLAQGGPRFTEFYECDKSEDYLRETLLGRSEVVASYWECREELERVGFFSMPLKMDNFRLESRSLSPHMGTLCDDR